MTSMLGLVGRSWSLRGVLMGSWPMKVYKEGHAGGGVK
eukprot:CAMPEP_0202904580 /NCGR_PEP_ID=MMETSP1392-20130828/30145_1 /ASSEMBLY_ACC=CAM_ASM_000868 /TAXON_ID=225041 /ORGANISM="Chlamydomonas chlamydogama, Strain SAG 11-48b" /LENGTH=37 /DNA_ID= /DNA_START= /DNA_END= /DNA_ORIENTATION=